VRFSKVRCTWCLEMNEATMSRTEAGIATASTSP
jgi:hypothetical protein